MSEQTLNAIARQVAELSRDEISGVVRERISGMTISEARGYIRARAGKIIRRRAGSVIHQFPNADRSTLQQIVRISTERVVSPVLRSAHVGVPQVPVSPQRLAA